MPDSPATGPQLVLGFDFGRRRIGVAGGDTLTRSARALATVNCSGEGPDWAHIERLMSQWRPALTVIGLPYNEDGSESPIAAAARGFAADLVRRFAVPAEFIDERYSSLDAQARLKDARASGLRKRRVTKSDIDSTAASVILERWFLQHR